MRRRGIASAMLQEAATIARKADVEDLYIDCLATTAAVYEKNGWKIYEREVGNKDSVVMLRSIKGLRNFYHSLQSAECSRVPITLRA